MGRPKNGVNEKFKYRSLNKLLFTKLKIYITKGTPIN
jgi:hypothetical protein